MQLRQGEAEFQSGKATVKEFTVKGKNSKEMLEKLEGTLYLTNYRLVMAREVPSGEPRVIFEFPLGALQNAETKGVFGKILNFEADLSEMHTGSKEKRPQLKKGFAKFSVKIHDVQTWAGQLSKAIKDRKEEM